MKKNNPAKNIKSGNKAGVLAGAIVGAALGVAAGTLLAPKSGKKTRKDVKRISGDFYRYITPQIKKMKRMGEAQYDALVAKGLKNYVKAKRLSSAQEKALKAEAKRAWKHIKGHLK